MNFPSPSEQPPRSFWIVARPEGRAAAELKSSVAAEPESPAAIQNPLMRFSAPSAHQVERIYQRGVPCPLRSAFAVSATLTVSSPLDPARLFHRAALVGFQGVDLHRVHREVRARQTTPKTLLFYSRQSEAEASCRPGFDSNETEVSTVAGGRFRRGKPRASPGVSVL